MIQEQFPAAHSLYNGTGAQPRPEFQGAENTCIAHGITSAVEAMAARAGEPMQLSARYLWYYRHMSALSVEGLIETANKVGLPLDRLDPYRVNTESPWNVIGLDEIPSALAMQDASTRKGPYSVERIAGAEGIKRALCQGHSIITVRVLPGGGEHCEAAIGYTPTGITIHGSGFAIFEESWETQAFTQLWAVSGPWAPVPAPGYIEGDLPSLAGGVLTIPKIRVYVGWPEPSLNFRAAIFKDVVCTPVANDSRVDSEVVWHSPSFTLYLPKLMVDGVLMHKVTLTRPTAIFVSAEQL